MKSFQNNISSIASILATTSLTVVSGGLASPLIKSFLQILPQTILQVLPLLKSKSTFITEHPEKLNHSIKQLFASSIYEALSNITILFSETTNTDSEKKKAKHLTKTLQKHLPNMLLEDNKIDFGETEIKNFLYEKDNEDAICNLIESQFESFGITDPFKSFLSKNLPSQIQLCFGEGLKDPANQNAWIAFQRMLTEEIRDDIKKIGDTQQSIKEDLSDLKFEKSGFSEEQVNEIRELVKLLNNKKFVEVKIKDGINQSLQSIEEKANTIIQITTETNITVAQLKKNIEKIDRQNRMNRIIFFALAACLLIAGLFIAYKSMDQPFTTTIQIYGWENEQHNPLNGKGTLILTLGDKNETTEINRQGEAVFKGILPEYNGKNVSVYIADTDGEPYYLVDSIITIQKNGITKVQVLLHGLEKLQGAVYDDVSGEGIPDVSITVAEITTTTNEKGEFMIDIPIEKQRVEQEIEIRKEGYKSKRQTIPMSGENKYRTVLERK
ncbi:MAG: carboxypeptidase-like regulatory domain-containing protein [Bacteroidales bacterium]|jgi:hypothetical protein|nr:carboxypeptidase-like regulatory domain-containing protein [Bacteroidales bacterium]